MLSKDYIIVDNSNIHEILKPLFKAKVQGIDCETTGLDPLTDEIRLIQIATFNHPVVIINLSTITTINRKIIKKLLSNATMKILHNGKFDWQFLNQAGFQLSGRFFDTQLAYKVLTTGLQSSSSLKAITRKLLHIQIDKTQQFSDWSKPLTKAQLEYAALDAALLLELYPILVRKLKQAKLLKIAQLEFKCMPAVAQMELNGMLFDLSQWQILGTKLEDEKNHAFQQLKQLRITSNSQMSLLPELTDIVNLNSPQQVLAALRTLGIPVQSTNQNQLVPLAAQYPIIQALLDYRRLSKIITTFTEHLPQYIHSKTGRIHPHYYQLGTRSGRFSCRQPPLQNTPRNNNARGCFIAAPGYKIIKADYSQIELRIIARLSGDTKMCQAYQQGADLHRLTASLVTGKLVGEVTEEDRRLAKAINFGLIFGMGAAKLQIYAQVKYGVAMSLEQARTFRKRFFDAYPGIGKWHETIRKAYIKGSQESRTLAGRRRRWTNKPRLSEMLNHPVQGLNADINKLAMARLFQHLATYQAKLICVIHDEIVLECPEHNVDQVRHILQKCMLSAAQKFLFPVPVVVDIQVSSSWGKLDHI
jgi:DNA polymerase-1